MQRAPNGIETRTAVEMRAAGRKLIGHAAVFDSPTRIADQFTEVVRRGAFTASLASGTDVVALLDHDMTKVLARTSAGNLKLWEDERGLAFEISLPNTTAANDALALVESRTAGGCSFAFRPAPDGGAVWVTKDTRELRAVNLVDVSIISGFPAYAAASVQARSSAAGMIADAMRRRRALEAL